MAVKLFVAHDGYTDRLQVFGLNGVYLRQWGAWGSGEGQFDQSPRGIAVKGEAVFVADTYNSAASRCLD